MSRAASITQQIVSGKNLMITDKALRLHRLIQISDDTALILNTQSVLTKYRSKLQKYVRRYSLSDSDVKKYQYKPERLAFDLYGTIELAPFILQINNMISATEFCNLENGLNLFSSGIIEFLNEVLILEKKVLSQNRAELAKDMAS